MKAQADLFEAARKRVKSEEVPKVIQFEDLFKPVLAAAHGKAIADSRASKCSYDKCLAVYKFLLLDAEWAQRMLSNVELTSKQGQFKRYAILLHPDKNQHPMAKEAFQRAQALLE